MEAIRASISIPVGSVLTGTKGQTLDPLPRHLRPFRIISFNFARIASISGSAKELSRGLTLFVFALVLLISLSSWAWLTSLFCPIYSG